MQVFYIVQDYAIQEPHQTPQLHANDHATENAQERQLLHFQFPLAGRPNVSSAHLGWKKRPGQRWAEVSELLHGQYLERKKNLQDRGTRRD
jgi:hypothetical protein